MGREWVLAVAALAVGCGGKAVVDGASGGAGVGDLQTIASDQANPTNVAVSSVAICWTNQGTSAANFSDGALMCSLK